MNKKAIYIEEHIIIARIKWVKKCKRDDQYAHYTTGKY